MRKQYDNFGHCISGLGMPYMPVSESCTSLNVDVPDSMGFETHQAINRIKHLIGGDVVAFVADRLGYNSRLDLCRSLAAEQIDAVAVAIYNIEAYRQGIIIGDQTGIGKGRQAAAIIRYAVHQGMKPVFFTEKPNLFSDLYRDLKAIGSGHLVPFIVNSREAKTDVKDEEGNIIYQALHTEAQQSIFQSQKIPAGYDFVMCTYSQVSSVEKKPVKPNFIREITQNNIIVLDESHNASGSSNTGEFLQAVVSGSKGVVFLSATFAKRPDNMPIYAQKTAISEANMTREELVDSITRGGVALQEILASQLVKEGQMLRRERAYDGIEVNYITLDKLEKKHRQISDTITEIIREIIVFQNTQLTPVFDELDKIAAAEYSEASARKGTANAGVDNMPYFSKVFNVINQMLFSIKAEAVADRAIQRLKEGKKPVIAFASTMGSFLEDMGVTEGETIKADFSAVLQKGLDGVMRYTERDAKGEPTYKMLKLQDLTPEAKEMYLSIQRRIDSVSTGISLSPIDVLIERIQSAGYRVAEVTGRKIELQINPRTLTAVVLKRKRLNTNDAFRMFNNNEVDVLMINQAGSTGASAHAVPTAKVTADKVQQRVMIVLQPELDINREVQKRGRINRTGQILKPIYDYISSAIPAEQRLMMMLQKKLKSLDANTTSNQKQSEKVLSTPDFLNKYGDRIVKEYLLENPEINKLIDDPLELENPEGEQKSEKETPEDAAHRVSGRVAILNTTMQQSFYNEIMLRYHDLVDYLKQTGEYDLEVETLNLQAETQENRVVKAGKGGRSVFATDSVLETSLCNVLKKPFKKSEVEKLIKDELQGKDAKKYQQEIIAGFDEFAASKLKKDIAALNQKYDALIAKIPEEKAIALLADPVMRKNAILQRTIELNEARTNAIHKEENLARNRADYLKTFLSFFVPGLGYNYPTLQYELGSVMTKAVFIGVQIDKRRPNPYAPSAVKFKFAISDSNKFIALPASSEPAKTLNAIITASMRLTEKQQEEILRSWDETIKSSTVSKKLRHIISGNLLQAFSDFRGKLVSYTTNVPGEEKKGILMPENWKAPEGQANRVIVPIGTAVKLFKDTEPGVNINTTSNATFSKNYNKTWTLYVPASRVRGGDIYLNTDVLSLVEGNNFNKVSDKMRAVFPSENLEKMLQLFQEKFNASVNIDLSLYDDIAGKKQKPKEVFLKLHHPPVADMIPVKADDIELLELEAEAVSVELELLDF